LQKFFYQATCCHLPPAIDIAKKVSKADASSSEYPCLTLVPDTPYLNQVMRLIKLVAGQVAAAPAGIDEFT
jgi:hypothetical protein